jgi:hypothetical protein
MLLSHLSRFDFVCCLISWGGHNGGGLSQKKEFFLTQLMFDKCIFPSYHKDFLLLTSTSEQFFSSLY